MSRPPALFDQRKNAGPRVHERVLVTDARTCAGDETRLVAHVNSRCPEISGHPARLVTPGKTAVQEFCGCWDRNPS